MARGRPPKVPPPPDSLDAEAKTRWRDVAKALAARGPVDTETLATYCQVWVRWRKAEATLAKTGPLVKNARGDVGPSPLNGVAKQAAATVRSLEQRLGIGDAAAAAEQEPAAGRPGRKRAGLFTRRALAEAFAVHLQTITGWEQDGLPVEIRGGPGRPSYYALPACIQWRIERELQARGASGSDVLSPQNERALLDRMRRDELELRLRQRRGELVPIEEVAREYADVALAVKARLRGIPDAVAQVLTSAARQGGAAAVKATLLERIDDVLRDLARGARMPLPAVLPPALEPEGVDDEAPAPASEVHP